MRIFFLMFLASLAVSESAIAQTEYEFDAELTVVGAVSDEDSAPTDTENLMGELSASGSASRVLENGVEVTGNITLRVQSDHPSRPGFAGSVLTCPPTISNCPSLQGNGVRGAFSRLSNLPFTDDVGPRGSIERAYIEIDGGWGALTLGKDAGVGARFYEGGPSVFALARGNDPILDPTGMNAIRLRNDISSSAAKVSYVTPRILGVRGGVSYTPDASVRTLDLDTQLTAAGLLEPELDDAMEIGLQAYHFFRSADLRVRGSLTWSQANSASPFYDDTQTTSFGFEIEKRDVYRVGASTLTSSNGGNGDYDSLQAGGEFYVGEWRLGANAARAEDDTIQYVMSSITVGASHEINDHVDMTIGYRASEGQFGAFIPGAENEFAADTVLLEFRIRK